MAESAAGAACSQAMSQSEPGTLDMYGAEWVTDAEYKMQPDAKRYEQYERSFAAVVSPLLHGARVLHMYKRVDSASHCLLQS